MSGNRAKRENILFTHAYTITWVHWVVIYDPRQLHIAERGHSRFITKGRTRSRFLFFRWPWLILSGQKTKGHDRIPWIRHCPRCRKIMFKVNGQAVISVCLFWFARWSYCTNSVLPGDLVLILDLLDLLPWRGQGPQQQLFDGFPPTVPITWISCSGVDCHAHVVAIRTHHVNPSFLWPSSPSLSMDISVKCNLWVSSIIHPWYMSKVA